MSNLRAVAVALLLATAATAMAFVPGYQVLAYDNELQTPLQKIGYTANGVGYGVKFDPWSVDCSDLWVEICTVKVRLCPPPIDGYYQEKVYILPAKSNGDPAPLSQALWVSDPYDVRIGAWWHTVPVTKPGGLWIKYPTKLYVFSMATNGYTQLFQWFDGVKNAPVATQWYYNGTVFSQFAGLSVGDIMIDLVVQKHDFAGTSIHLPWFDDCHYPQADVTNWTGFGEPVAVRFWIKNRCNGHIVYDQTITWNAPVEEHPVAHWLTFPDAGTLPPGSYTAYVQTKFHAPSQAYPIGERNQYNDQYSKNFQIGCEDGKTPGAKNKTD